MTAAARSALLVATATYDDERLADLRSPEADVDLLAEVLSDGNRGGFDVSKVVDQDRGEVQLRIEQFFSGAKPRDMLLLYVTGHGFLSEHKELFFAMPGTKRELLHATALDSNWVRQQLDRSRSRQIVVILDCCHSGAFPAGFSHKGDRDVGVLHRFQGSGRVTLTASSEYEYAFEGDQRADFGENKAASVFTRLLIEGLETGHADTDEDGRISAQELYQYVCDRAPDENAYQTPRLQGDMAGDLFIANNPRAAGAALPPDLREAVKSPRAGIRQGTIIELERLLREGGAKEAKAARQVLRGLTEDESAKVRDDATRALRGSPNPPQPEETGSHTNGKPEEEPPPPDRPEYAAAHRWKTTLVELIERQGQIAAKLELDDERRALEELNARLADESFKVLVLGDFSRGKSTFINALCGEKVLPVSMTPTTAVITEVKWADRPRALLYPWDVDERPKEIPVEELERHIKLGEDEPSPGDPPAKFGKAVVYWPLALCRNRVEIIDSPGLNEHASREKIAREYLKQADAVLFVMTCQQLATKEEREVITQDLVPAGHEHLFFILNWFNQVDEEDRPDLIARAQKLSQHTRLGEKGIFYLDAKGALKARLASNEDAEAASGILRVEQELEHFLAVDRARVKLLPRARVLQRTLRAMSSRKIPERQRMLELDLETFETRVAESREPLMRAEGERDEIIARIDSLLGTTQTEMVARARAFHLRLADQVEDWVKEFQPQSKFKVRARKDSANAIATEVARHVGKRAKEETQAWIADVLTPFIDERTAELTTELDRRAADFLAHVDEIRDALAAPDDEFDVPVDPGIRDISPSERLLAAAGGWIGGPGTMMLGAQGGFKSMRTALVGHIALGVIGIAAGLTPVGLTALLLSSAMWKQLRERASIKTQLKSTVAGALAEQLRASADDRSKELANSALDGLRAGRDAVRKGLDAEIEVIHEQVNAVLEAKRAGQTAVAKDRESLESAQRELHELDARLDDLISEIAIGRVEDDTAQPAHR